MLYCIEIKQTSNTKKLMTSNDLCKFVLFYTQYQKFQIKHHQRYKTNRYIFNISSISNYSNYKGFNYCVEKYNSNN